MGVSKFNEDKELLKPCYQNLLKPKTILFQDAPLGEKNKAGYE